MKDAAAEVAAALRGTTSMTPQLRARFVALRTALFQRGVFNPLLARFESATVASPTQAELAEELAALAESLPSAL